MNWTFDWFGWIKKLEFTAIAAAAIAIACVMIGQGAERYAAEASSSRVALSDPHAATTPPPGRRRRRPGALRLVGHRPVVVETALARRPKILTLAHVRLVLRPIKP